jgi:hypothetical protein
MPLDNTINSLKNYFNLHQGIQRANRFSISFFGLPEQVNRYQDVEYVADEFLLNQRAIDHVADNLTGYGVGRLIPRRQRFSNGMALSFPVAGDNRILLFLNDWMNSIYSGGYAIGPSTTKFTLEYYDNIVSPVKMSVNLLDLNGTVKTRFIFSEIFPTEILPIKLSSLDRDKYMSVNAVFNYREFRYERA